MMSTHGEKDRATKRWGTGSHYPQRTRTRSDIAKKKWLQKYTGRLFRFWLHRQTPFGVARTYAEHIKEDLAEFYEDPLKRKFIETTYHWHSSDKRDF